MRSRRPFTHLVCAVAMACVVAASAASDEARRAVPPGGTASGGWTTLGASIRTPAGAPFVIAGISWYGLETPRYVLYGLDQRDYRAILIEAKHYSFNTVRIPYSNEIWETNPLPNPEFVAACPACKGMRARDVLALIINYAGSIGLHVILDDHRSDAGSSSGLNGFWYDTGFGHQYTEQVWIRDWRDVQRWVHGVHSRLGLPDTISVHDVAADGFPTVLGYDLRNEPHTPPGLPYLTGATWGTGDGIDPHVNPNPNPFAPACVATSTCHDWRLAAERAGDAIFGDATARGWALPLVFVQGISDYPTAQGDALHGPFDSYRWGGQLEGVNGNANNPGAPIVFNAGGTATKLGPAISDQLVYTTRDYGPTVSPTDWFTSQTCYHAGCARRGTESGLADLWCQHWAYLSLPRGRYGACMGGVNPRFRSAFPWRNTGSTPYSQAPVWLGEFGTGNDEGDLSSSWPGSQGQWFTDLINFIQSSYARTQRNDPGIPVQSLSWTYWALNSEDSYGLLGDGYVGLANPMKQYSFLCFIQHQTRSAAIRQCGSTGALPTPR
jgi:endoglucanase